MPSLTSRQSCTSSEGRNESKFSVDVGVNHQSPQTQPQTPNWVSGTVAFIPLPVGLRFHLIASPRDDHHYPPVSIDADGIELFSVTHSEHGLEMVKRSHSASAERFVHPRGHILFSPIVFLCSIRKLFTSCCLAWLMVAIWHYKNQPWNRHDIYCTCFYCSDIGILNRFQNYNDNALLHVHSKMPYHNS
jgi:hypothetical protein